MDETKDAGVELLSMSSSKSCASPPPPDAEDPDANADANAVEKSSRAEEDEPEAEDFNNYFEFLLTSIGYCVGLGNLIVFPGRVYNYGGGAFIVAYWCFVFVLGIPMYTHDLKVGQYFKRGAFQSFYQMNRRLWGVGIGHILIGFIMIVYFNTIIGWAVIYFIHSFRGPTLPWASDTRTFFYDTVLQASTGLQDMNRIVWPIFAANLFAWVVTALVLCKGVSSGGKVAYFTVIAPYICIIALIIRGAMLPGAMDGIRAYCLVDPKKLGDYQTWTRAATQVFYSTGVAMGAIVTFGSYQSAKTGRGAYVRDGAMIPIINALTSLLGGFAIFPMLGYLSHETGEDIDSLDLTGFGITFVAYTQGLASFPKGLAQFCSVIFFLMIITLGIDTQIGVAEAVITFAKETEAGKRLSKRGTWIVTVVVCIVGWLLSLPCTTDAGYYWVTLLWDYGNWMSMFIVAGLSVIGSSFFAGIKWNEEAMKSLGVKREYVHGVLRHLAYLVCFVLFGIAAWGLSPYPTTNGAHGEGTGIFPTWAQVLSGLINFGPAFIAIVALVVPPAWIGL